MPIDNLPIIKNSADLWEALSKPDKPVESAAMSMDFGTKKIGLAKSDTNFIIASPIENYTRANVSADTHYACEAIIKHRACLLVVGLPIDLRNQLDNKLYGLICDFLQKVYVLLNKQSYKQPYIYMQDERLTTRYALKILKSMNINTCRGKGLDDKIAAACMLQEVLDIMRRHAI